MQTDPIGNGDDLNLYIYVGNDPHNGLDPNGTICIAVWNDASDFCVRSLIYQYTDSDPRISSKTSFFAAASIVTNALGSSEQSPFMRKPSEKLENSNLNRARQIRMRELYASGSIQANTAEFVHFEQSIVQDELDALKTANPEDYDRVVSDANSALNGPLSTLARGGDPNFARAVAATRESLGRDIDFANQSDREVLGNAVAREAERNRSYCTGTRIRRC